MASRVEQSSLDNGLRVVTEGVAGSRAISIGVLVEAGPADELPGQEGLAHFVEHLLFQGTASRSALEIARLMDGAGGQTGGFVTRDYTCFHATVLDDYRYHALDLLGDMLLNPTFPDEALARQKEAVAFELEGLADSPQHRVEALVKELAFGDHPLGRPIAGTPESVRRLSREDAIYFCGHHYTPDRMVITASGSLEPADFLAQTRDAFWRLLGSSPQRQRRPTGFQRGVVLESAALQQAYFALALPAPAIDHPDRYAVHVFDRLLGGGVSSRLFRRVREELGLAYAIGSNYQGFADGGVLVISGWTAPENLGAVIEVTLEELAALARESNPVGPEELTASTTALVNQFLIASESSFTRMSRLATQQLYFGRPLPSGEILDALRGVDHESLHLLTEDWLRPGLAQAALAVLAPAHRLGLGEQDLEIMLSNVSTLSPFPGDAPPQEVLPCH